MAEHSTIFKSTFLFSFVQVIKMLVSLIKNKVIAVLLGAEGMGIVSVFNNVSNLIKTGASFGISQSAVRDVSEANVCNDDVRFSKIIKVTNRIVHFTSLLGLVITLVLSPFLSKWNFGNYSYTFSFILLSLAVATDVFADNQFAILKGMRHIFSLAKASLYSSIFAVLTSLPVLIIWKERGIVPSIVISSVAIALITCYFVSKIDYDRKINVSFKETYLMAAPMVKMGFALMVSNFLAFLFKLVVIIFIRKEGGLEEVGIYNAGMSLVNMYFSLVTTALTTDYYPRISAIHSDINKLSSEIRNQSEVGLIIFFPLMTIFIALSPLLIRFLYTDDFLGALSYTNVAVIGMLISIVSDCYGYVFIVKQDSRLYLILAILFNVLLLPVYFYFYKLWALWGLGIAYTINNMTQLIVYILLSKLRYKIDIDFNLLGKLSMILGVLLLCVFSNNISNINLRIIFNTVLVLLSLGITYYILKYKMNISMISIIKKIRK